MPRRRKVKLPEIPKSFPQKLQLFVRVKLHDVVDQALQDNATAVFDFYLDLATQIDIELQRQLAQSQAREEWLAKKAMVSTEEAQKATRAIALAKDDRSARLAAVESMASNQAVAAFEQKAAEAGNAVEYLQRHALGFHAKVTTLRVQRDVVDAQLQLNRIGSGASDTILALQALDGSGRGPWTLQKLVDGVELAALEVKYLLQGTQGGTADQILREYEIEHLLETHRAPAALEGPEKS